MQLQRLHIHGFGTLRAQTIEFGTGITVLLGPNEAGKSTALHCLAQVLMGKPSQRSLFPDFTPWDGGEFAASLELLRDGVPYRLERHFGETGPRAVALFQCGEHAQDRLLTREAAEVRRWVAEMLGTADDRLFYRVFCLTQADMSPLDNYAGLREQLERAASGAEVAVAAAVQRIDARLATLRRGIGQPALPQNWGRLKRAEEARREWEARLLDARHQQQRLATVRESIQQLQRRIEQTTARIADITALLAHEQTRRDLHNRLEELRAAWGTVEQARGRAEHFIHERARLQHWLAALPPAFADPAQLRQQLHTVAPDAKDPWWIGAVVAIIGVALGLSSIGKFSSPPVGYIGIAFIIYSGILLWLRQRRKRHRNALLASLSVGSLVEAQQRVSEAERYQHELTTLQLAEEAIGVGTDDAERRRSLAREMAVQEEKLAQIPGQPLTAEAAHRLTTERHTLQAELPDWQQQERELQRELAVLEQAERDLVDAEDGMAYWRNEAAHAREEEASLLLAHELLSQAGEQAHGELAHPLAAHIAPFFAAMTGGRYPRVQVDGDANTFTVTPVDADGAGITPQQLSRGTRDQLLLAVRLALGEVIAGPTGSPIFLLDDPLLHFDDDRRREALAMLSELAKRRQILLVTHDETLLADLPHAQVQRLAAVLQISS